MITHPVLSAAAAEGMKLGLQRIEQLLTHLDDPHLACPVVHVAGTNGKGSVCTLVTAALVEAGYRVGTFTSPHLEHVNERIRLDGVPLPDGELNEAIEALDRARWDWARHVGMSAAPLTYFEFVTALAFMVFASRRVDVAVIEVGLGGRLDATNVVKPIAAAVTSIGLDHVDQLGHDLGGIAAEKAAIIKPGCRAVRGPMAGRAAEVVAARALAVGAPLWAPGTDLLREQRGESWVFSTPEGRVGPVTLAMPGVHQGANASVAVGLLHQLRAAGFHLPDEAIERGLSTGRIGGRLEWLTPNLLVDGAHNRAGAEALAAYLLQRPRCAKRILLFGMGEGRDPAELLGPLWQHVDEVVLTRCAHPKAMDPSEIAARIEAPEVLLSDGGPLEDCLAEVVAEADETVVAGSLFLVGAARSLVASGALD